MKKGRGRAITRVKRKEVGFKMGREEKE